MDLKDILSFSWPPVRPWFDFCDLFEFSVPRTGKLFKERLLANLDYYQSNYVGIMLLSFIVPMCLRTLVVVGVILCILLWVVYAFSQDGLRIGSLSLSKETMRIALIVATVVILVLCGGWMIVYLLAFSVAGIVAHLSLRNPPPVKRTSHTVLPQRTSRTVLVSVTHVYRDSEEE